MDKLQVYSPIIIRYTGLFDFDALYGAIIDWCKNQGYIWHEQTYKHKVPSPKGAEQEWKWVAEKEITDYMKYEILFHPHAWDITEVEIVKDGKKKTLTNARMQIIMTGFLILDWQKKWEKGKFSKLLGRAYNKMIRREIESVYYDVFWYKLWNLQAVIKKYFDMQAKAHEYKKYIRDD